MRGWQLARDNYQIKILEENSGMIQTNAWAIQKYLAQVKLKKKQQSLQ